MMEVKDPRVLSCLNNYQIHLIAPAQMEDKEIMKFRSSLREVLFFIKYSKDKENLNRILKSNEKRFREILLSYDFQIGYCQDSQHLQGVGSTHT